MDETVREIPKRGRALFLSSLSADVQMHYQAYAFTRGKPLANLPKRLQAVCRKDCIVIFDEIEVRVEARSGFTPLIEL